MTGWQGNEGGGYGGGWNPQQDPYGGQQPPYGGQPQYGGQQQYPGGQPQYGADPYGGQYGSDPYGANPANPYGPGGTAAYPAYPTGYQPGFGQQPPEPPKRSKQPLIIGIVVAVVLAVVGTVVTILLVNKDDEQPVAGGTPSSSSRPRPSSAPKLPSSARRPPSSGARPSGKGDWITLDLKGGGTYKAPPDWKKAPGARRTGLGVDFEGGAEVGSYSCGGAGYSRGFTASGEVQGKEGGPVDLTNAVSDFAKSFAETYYKQPKVDVPTPTPITVSGQKAATVTAKLTVTPVKPECDAATGEVAVTGIEIQRDGKAVAVRMLVVVNDLSGGPANPPALPDPLAEEILDTMQLR